MLNNSHAELIECADNVVTIQVKVDLNGSFLEIEQSILDGCNKVGCIATEEALHQFDSDGSPIKVGGVKLTSRTKSNKNYHSPYGSISIKRHIYQTSKGGETYCPLEDSARIIQNATPRMANTISKK